MTNKFNELSSDEMEEIQSDSSSPSDYKPDADMEKKGYYINHILSSMMSIQT